MRLSYTGVRLQTLPTKQLSWNSKLLLEQYTWFVFSWNFNNFCVFITKYPTGLFWGFPGRLCLPGHQTESAWTPGGVHLDAVSVCLDTRRSPPELHLDLFSPGRINLHISPIFPPEFHLVHSAGISSFWGICYVVDWLNLMLEEGENQLESSKRSGWKEKNGLTRRQWKILMKPKGSWWSLCQSSTLLVKEIVWSAVSSQKTA